MGAHRLIVQRMGVVDWAKAFGLTSMGCGRHEKYHQCLRNIKDAYKRYDECVTSVGKKGSGMNLVGALGKKAACDIFHKMGD